MSKDTAASIIEPIVVGKSVEDVVTERLRRLIVRGRLPAESRLVHRKLAGQFHVSPTPVRSAVLRLRSEGFVTFDENGHGHIRPLTREDLEELSAARAGVEGLAAKLGASAVDPPSLTRMADLLAALKVSAAARDRDTYLKLRWDFHRECYATAQRPRLLGEVERLYWRVERYNHILLSDRDRFTQSLAHYEGLLDASRNGDGSAAERAIRDSVQWAVAVLSPVLPSDDDLRPPKELPS